MTIAIFSVPTPMALILLLILLNQMMVRRKEERHQRGKGRAMSIGIAILLCNLFTLGAMTCLDPDSE
jgi:hypothetical protein